MSAHGTTTSSGIHPQFAQGRRVGFTAFRERVLFRLRGDRILTHLEALGGATGFVTGGCIGGDHYLGQTLAEIFPDHFHTVIVPADRSRVAAWWRGNSRVRVIEMAPDTDYKDRNLAVVNMSTVLIGYPQFPERDPRSRRSGSWQTVRMARRFHEVQPLVFPLSRFGGE